MQTEIKKWGNSAVVRLPAPMLSELGLTVGSRIELKHEKRPSGHRAGPPRARGLVYRAGRRGRRRLRHPPAGRRG